MNTLTLDEFLKTGEPENLIGYYWVRLNPGRHGQWEVLEFVGRFAGDGDFSGFRIGDWKYDHKNIIEIYPERIPNPTV
jgi:hypothetical protein